MKGFQPATGGQPFAGGQFAIGVQLAVGVQPATAIQPASINANTMVNFMWGKAHPTPLRVHFAPHVTICQMFMEFTKTLSSFILLLQIV